MAVSHGQHGRQLKLQAADPRAACSHSNRWTQTCKRKVESVHGKAAKRLQRSMGSPAAVAEGTSHLLIFRRRLSSSRGWLYRQ